MSNMARSPTGKAPKRIDRCTAFQVHVEETADTNVIDFTARRLVRCAAEAKDPQQRMVLMALIVDYLAGHVAVAWRRGRPVPLRITVDG